MGPADIGDLASRIRAGSIRALSRGLTWIEAGGDRAEALSEELYPYSGRAHVVGVTGAPGAGKSTLVRALARAARTQRLTVGVLAIDPSSPFSGGSMLGDRIRMNDLSADPGVFIRSMATRGALGGLCRAAAEAVDLMSAAGRDLVLVETVGVGQDEVDVMRLVHTTVVVSVPGLGDEIQALKAGIMEIADIHAVNKADREGANRIIGELRAMLTMTMPQFGDWMPPIVTCVATNEKGSAQLLEQICAHWTHLGNTGGRQVREQRIAEARVLKIAHGLVAATLARPIGTDADALRTDVARVAQRSLSPYRCARALLGRASDAEKASSHV
jgi:LAO/AO transport system kinase